MYDTHPYSEEWTTDPNYHWHASTCEHSTTTDYGAHDYSSATCTQPETCKVCGYQKGSALGHDCKYSTNENVITQTCTRCNHTKTATITVTGECRYTGSALEPCTVIYSSGWYGAKNYTLKYENNVNVGKAKCSIEENNVSAYLEFQIEKGTLTGIWASDQTVVYDGKEHGITVQGVPMGATLWYQSDIGDGIDKCPVYSDVGSYTVKYWVNKDSYETFYGSAKITISKAENEWLTKPVVEDRTYGEAADTPDTGSAKFGTVKVEYKPENAQDSEYTTEAPTQAGNYTVRFGVEDNKNYTGLSMEKPLKIARVKVTVEADDKSKTYGEEDPQLTWKLKEGTLVSGDELAVNVSRTQGEDVDTYIITASQTDGANPNYEITFETGTLTIGIADRSAPEGLTGTAEDIDGRGNGTITGVTNEMEYRKNDETDYTVITGMELNNLADGTYYIRYKKDSNHNASPETKIVLSNDAKLKVTVPKAQTGYTLTASNSALKWNESTTITFTLKEGYSKLENFAVKVNGNPITLDKDGKYTVANVQENITVTVEGVADITAPTAEITLGENKWNKFFNGITFGLFFKDTQKITITAEDKGSGVEKISYYLSTTELTEEQVKELSSDKWTEYTGAFNLNPQDEYIIYAKAVDKDNNAKYISSEQGVVIDSIAPVILGIADGETHYGDTTFTVTDKHIKEVKVDGNKVTLTTDGKYTVIADGKEHTIVAIDKSSNASAEIKITVITIASLDDTIDGITTDNVKSSDKKAIEEVQSLVNGLINSGKEFTDTEKEQLANIKANTENLLKKISDVSDEMNNLDSSAKDTAKADAPATGDGSSEAVWLVCALVSSGMLLAAAYGRKRKEAK